MTATLRREDARRAAIERLREAGSETPVLDADVLLAHALARRKEEIYAHPEEPLTAPARSAYEELVARRARGEPVAYLRGVKEFYGLAFVVDPRVLIPRPETETLVAETVRWASRRAAPRIVDLGTGSGAVAVCVAMELPLARVVAVDASEDALAVARDNAARHDVAERIAFLRGDLLGPVRGTVDAVAANLPYLPSAALDEPGPTSLAFEPRRALDGGADGLDVIRRAIAQLPDHLAPDGAAFFECDPGQVAEVGRLLRDALGVEPRVVRDLARRDRVVAAALGA